MALATPVAFFALEGQQTAVKSGRPVGAALVVAARVKPRARSRVVEYIVAGYVGFVLIRLFVLTEVRA